MVDEYYKLDIIELDFALLMLLGPILYQFYERCKRMGFLSIHVCIEIGDILVFPFIYAIFLRTKRCTKMYKDVQRLKINCETKVFGPMARRVRL